MAAERYHHGPSFSMRPTAAHNGTGTPNPPAACLAPRLRLKARGVRQSGEISQFRGAPRKCAVVLTGARRLARTPKSLARNNKTGCGRSGNGIKCRREPRFATEPTPSGRTNHEPRRRACVAFAYLVCRPLRYGDLDVISACMPRFWDRIMRFEFRLFSPAALAVLQNAQ